MFTAERFNTLTIENKFIYYIYQWKFESFFFVQFHRSQPKYSTDLLSVGNSKKSRFSRCIVTHEAAWKLRPTSPISGRKSRREAKQRGSFRAEIFTIIRTNREPGHSASPTGKRVSPDPAEIPTGREIRSAHSPRYRYRLSPRRRTRS